MNVSWRFVERHDCPACGGSEGQVLLSVPFTDVRVLGFIASYYGGRVPNEIIAGVPYEIRSCPRCALLWQGWILDEAGMRVLYEDWISAEDSLAKKRDAELPLFAGYAREMEAIAALVGRKQAEVSVLDFGMGWGYWCRMAQAFGFHVSGYEVSRRRVEHARQMGVDAINDWSALSRHDFDFINCEQVIEHLPDPLETLRGLTGLLRTGGVIRVSVPDGRGMAERILQSEWRAAKDALHPLEHINCFTHPALCGLAETAGLNWLASSGLPVRNQGTILYFQCRVNSSEQAKASLE